MEDFNSQIAAVKSSQSQVYKTLALDLTNARSNEEFIIAGNYLTVFEATDFATNIGVRFNESSADSLTLTKSRGLKIPFYRFFVSHAAQPGKSVTLIFGVSDTSIESLNQVEVTLSGLIDVTGSAVSISLPVAIAEAVIEEATAPELDNVTCTLAATEYSKAIPAGAKKFTIKARGGDLQVCFTATESGTKYLLLTDGQSISEDLLKLTGKTLYFQSPTAGAVAEVIAWT